MGAVPFPSNGAPPSIGAGRYVLRGLFSDSGGTARIWDAVDTKCGDNPVLLKVPRYERGEGERSFRYGVTEAVAWIGKCRAQIGWERKLMVRFRNEGIACFPHLNDAVTERSASLDGEYEGTRGRYRLPASALEGEPWLVMERIHGVSLERLASLAEWRAGLERRLVEIGVALATAMVRLHRKFDVGGEPACFLLQDLKPANVLVGPAGEVWLVDLGAIALRLGERTTEPAAGLMTLGYAAPEAADGDETAIDERFDVYTLGATLWHCATGVDPRTLPGRFPRLDAAQCGAAGLRGETIAILAKCLERDPGARYACAADVRRELLARQVVLSSG